LSLTLKNCYALNMKTKRNLSLATILSLTAPGVASAALPTPPGIEIILINTDKDSLLVTLFTLIGWILAFVGPLAVLFIIIGGILYMTSAGNPERVSRAKKTLTYAIVGLVVVVLSYWIVNFTQSLLNYFFK